MSRQDRLSTIGGPIMRAIIAFAILTSFAGGAAAEPQCTKEPQSAWLPESAIKEKALAAGHTISVFKKTSGNCYEIYGRSAAGKRIEIYYHQIGRAHV